MYTYGLKFFQRVGKFLDNQHALIRPQW